MPSTFTANLGLEQPANGEQAGAWGQTVNTTSNILDRAINGSLSLSLSGTSSTLTTSQGAASNGQYKILELTGSPSGTHTITIDPATAQTIYLVNNTTAQSVIFTQGSGGNVTIVSGASAIIYSSGAGATAKVTNITNFFAMSSVKITGGTITGITDLAVADGGTGASTAAAALVNFGLTATATELNYTSGVTSAIQTQLGTKIPNNADAALTGGYTTTADADGTFSSGTYTPVPSGGNMKTITNGGAFTLAAPTATGDYTLIIRMVNNATAGAVTLSGFNKSGGDTLTTTNGNAFFLYITKCGGSVALIVQALQ